MSKAFRTLPSEIYGIHSYLDAFAFNKAVHAFGSHVSTELESVEGKDSNEIKSKRLRVVQQYFPEATGASKGRFADPSNRS